MWHSPDWRSFNRGSGRTRGNMPQDGDKRDTRTLTFPFSKTYPSMDKPSLAFDSCFFAASFTRRRDLAPALTAPQAL